MQIEVLILQPDQISFFHAVNIFRLRTEVFCTEQRCWYIDPDKYDLIATHILIYNIENPEQKQLIGYARIYQKGELYIIGRICTHLLYRNKGLGKKIMMLALQQCPNKSTIYLQAQAYLKKFYEGFGFSIQDTTLIWEDAVPHIAMVKTQE